MTDQEKKDEEQIHHRLLQNNEKLEKDRKIKSYMHKKLAVQAELLKTYELARVEEEKKVESSRRKIQQYQDWDKKTEIVGPKQQREYQEVIDKIVREIEGGQLRKYNPDESGQKDKIKDQMKTLKTFVADFISTVKESQDLQNMLSNQEEEIHDLDSQLIKSQKAI